MTEQEIQRQAIIDCLKSEVKKQYVGMDTLSASCLDFEKMADGLISELRKPSENLVDEIIQMMKDKSLDPSQTDELDDYLSCRDYESIAKSIANLAPFDTNAEKELLESLKESMSFNVGWLRVLESQMKVSTTTKSKTALSDCIERSKTAIQNAQSK